MRAPPESFNPITGAPVFSARSMILTIFFAFCSRQRSAEYREILRGCHICRTTVDQPEAGDEAIAVNRLFLHSEITAAVANQLVHFLKSAVAVEQQVDTLPAR